MENLVQLALKYFRTRLGLTQEELGTRAQLDQAQISQYELGLRTPGDPILARLAEALNVSPAYLLLKHVELRAMYTDGTPVETEGTPVEAA